MPVPFELFVENLRLFARRFPDSAHSPDSLFLYSGLRANKVYWQPAATALMPTTAT